MSWLVTLVTRPMVELPTPLVARGPDARPDRGTVVAAATSSRLFAGGGTAQSAQRFSRPSPVEVEVEAGEPSSDALVVVDSSSDDRDLDEQGLPPLHVPEAPVVASVGEVADDRVESGGERGLLTPEAGGAEAVVAAARAADAGLPGVLADEAPPHRVGEGASAQAAATDGLLEVPSMKVYKVRRGDTLVKIMRRVWGSDDPELMAVLIGANPRLAKCPDRILAGEELQVPTLRSARRMLAEVGQRGRHAPGVVLAAAQSSMTGRGPADSGRGIGHGDRSERQDVRWYTIRKRDCLASIARWKLNDEGRWREIAKLNGLRDADRIIPGTRIKLPPISNDT